ncbi:MAG: hypothetical protein HDT06_01460 [Bacteroidales bacterium]|nr:hypothetical protein [Bacteroidales bacterium]
MRVPLRAFAVQIYGKVSEYATVKRNFFEKIAENAKKRPAGACKHDFSRQVFAGILSEKLQITEIMINFARRHCSALLTPTKQ